MRPPPPRLARVVLVTPDGRLLGALPATPIATPWWQDVELVAQAVRAAHGVDVTVLRLLKVGEIGPAGIEITYLAETAAAEVAAQPWEGVLDEQPLRLSYAKVGGPAADLAWAERVLTERGYVQTGPPVQVRTWNLSSLWRIPVAGQMLWLKAVPQFFAHEGALVQVLAGAGERVPNLLGHEAGRMLMTEILGDDLYGAPLPVLLPMVDLLVGLQRRWADRTDELVSLGLPDWRGVRLAPAISAVIARYLPQAPPNARATLERFAADLAGRLAEVAACGLPDTVVHGDFHPGNLRGSATAVTLLDWGDSTVGHPLLDQPAFLGRIPARSASVARRRWHSAWRAAAPGSDPDRASALLAPVAAARQAVSYQGFLENTEPSEHPYHRADPLERLLHTAALLRRRSRPAERPDTARLVRSAFGELAARLGARRQSLPTRGGGLLEPIACPALNGAARLAVAGRTGDQTVDAQGAFAWSGQRSCGDGASWSRQPSPPWPAAWPRSSPAPFGSGRCCGRRSR